MIEQIDKSIYYKVKTILETLKKSDKYEDHQKKVKDIISDANKERAKLNDEIRKRKRNKSDEGDKANKKFKKDKKE